MASLPLPILAPILIDVLVLLLATTRQLVFKRCTKWTILTLAVSLAALGAGHAGAAGGDEKEYPWCVQGSINRCYYMNREQCEETVDYHGFCIPNPEYQERKPQRR